MVPQDPGEAVGSPIKMWFVEMLLFCRCQDAGLDTHSPAPTLERVMEHVGTLQRPVLRAGDMPDPHPTAQGPCGGL